MTLQIVRPFTPSVPGIMLSAMPDLPTIPVPDPQTVVRWVLVALFCGMVLALIIRPVRHGRVFARFVLGRPLTGYRRTDATFLRPGRNLVGKRHDRVYRWHRWPEWRHAAIRVGSVVAVVGSAGLYTLAPAAMVAADSTALAGGAALGVWRGRRAWLMRDHVKERVRPLHIALGPVLGLTEYDPWRDYLTVPLTCDQDEATPVRVQLPANWQATREAKSLVENTVRDKLGMQDTVTDWRLAGSRPYVEVKVAPRPPTVALWSDALEVVAAAPESAPVIGLGHRGRVVSVQLDAESPHVLVSAGTGGGKSVLFRGMTCQMLRNGAVMVVCDVKRISQKWTRGIPSVVYCRTPADIHDAIIAVSNEAERRYTIIEEDPDNENPDVGPRVVLMLEEMNATIRRLQKHWMKIRTSEDPKVSPAVDALGDILFLGRACRIHVFAAAQMMTARTLGGPEARENFATRILARYTLNAWKMLVPEVWPMPRVNRHAGRVQVVIGGEASETQTLFPTDAEAHAWALSGIVVDAPSCIEGLPVSAIAGARGPAAGPGGRGAVAPSDARPSWIAAGKLPPGVPVAPVVGPVATVEPHDTPPRLRLVRLPEEGTSPLASPTSGPGQTTPSVPGQGDGGTPADQGSAQSGQDGRSGPDSVPAEPRYTLAEAAREGVLPGSYDAVKRAMSRDRAAGRAPEGVTEGGRTTYTARELQSWHAARPVAGGRHQAASGDE